VMAAGARGDCHWVHGHGRWYRATQAIVAGVFVRRPGRASHVVDGSSRSSTGFDEVCRRQGFYTSEFVREAIIRHITSDERRSTADRQRSRDGARFKDAPPWGWLVERRDSLPV